MAKDICLVFPKFVRKVRRKRGFAANVKLNSHPSNEEFFGALADKMIMFLEETNGDSKEITTLYLNETNGHYGLGVFSWCTCNVCHQPILGCINGQELQLQFNRDERHVYWFNNLDELINGMFRFLVEEKAVAKVIETVYPDSPAERKRATDMQAQLIMQDREARRLRQEADLAARREARARDGLAGFYAPRAVGAGAYRVDWNVEPLGGIGGNGEM